MQLNYGLAASSSEGIPASATSTDTHISSETSFDEQPPGRFVGLCPATGLCNAFFYATLLNRAQTCTRERNMQCKSVRD